MPVLKKTSIFMSNLPGLLGFSFAAILLLRPTVASSDVTLWQVSAGGWSTAANWDHGEPTADDYACIYNGGTATITQNDEVCQYIKLGASSGTGTIEMTGGSLDVALDSVIGDNNTGTFNQRGGSNTIANTLYLAYSSGSNGTYNLSDTGQLSADNEYIGYNGSGKFTQTGGTNTVSSTLCIGGYSGSNHQYELSGTGQLFASNVFIGGLNGISGGFIQNGGTCNITSLLSFTSAPGSYGGYALNGGTLNVKSISNGNANIIIGSATLRASGDFNTSIPIQLTGINGSATIDTAGYNVGFYGVVSGYGLTKTGSGTLILAGDNTMGGQINFNEGLIQIYNAKNLEHCSYYYFNGGGLKFNNSFSLSVFRMEFQSGGGIIDTQSYDVSLSSIIVGSGNLTKKGSGTLSYSVNSSFSGAVNIDGGYINAWPTTFGNGPQINFSGGGLKLYKNYDPSVHIMNFQSGGAILNNYDDVTLANAIGNGGSGSLTKNNSGKLTLNGKITYTGNTIVSQGSLEIAGGIDANGTSLIDIQTGARVVLKTVDISKPNLDITFSSGSTLEVLNGIHEVGDISRVRASTCATIVDSGATLIASSINQSALRIGSGAKVVIRPIPGGPLSDDIHAVPEPTSIALLACAFVMLAGIWLKKIPFSS
jgi:autotransporter-associated beta strand protein